MEDDNQHTRYNPLKDEWVLVSPHRLRRPWQGKQEAAQTAVLPTHDKNNPLCPGSTRPNGKVNPDYKGIFTFDNDFPALLKEDETSSTDKLKDDMSSDSHPLLRSGKASGTCRVICFHDRLDMSLPLMTIEEIIAVIKEWMNQMSELSQKYRWVQIFENKGDIMGCSNPHPHCQVWASCFVPNEPHREDVQQRNYHEKNGTSMLLDYVNLELKEKVRTVAENANWIVVVPFWAVWPYEVLLLPKQEVRRLTDLNYAQVEDLAKIMKIFLTMYDNLFKTSFPYSMGWHGAPNDVDGTHNDCSHWQLHAHYYPPLLRSAAVKKHMVGYEMLAQPQRDLTAEQAAKTLRELSTVHFKDSAQQS